MQGDIHTDELTIDGEIWTFRVTPLRLRVNGSASSFLVDWDRRDLLVSGAGCTNNIAYAVAKAMLHIMKLKGVIHAA